MGKSIVMKRLTYYQVHKNKKPKRIKPKKTSFSARNIRIYYSYVDSFSTIFNKLTAHLLECFERTMDESPKRGVSFINSIEKKRFPVIDPVKPITPKLQ